jgi:tripartite-type tricarboxylate transporter receptor subunit TctC
MHMDVGMANSAKPCCLQRIVGLLLIAAFTVALHLAVSAEPADDFYKGKTVRIINWSSPGGEYDLHGRLLARYIGHHLAGQPTVIQEYMTGAGGIVAANYMSNLAPHDGTVLGVMNNGLPLFQTFNLGAARYDAATLNWLGAIAPAPEIMIAWHTAPVKSFRDLLSTNFIIGVTGKDSTSWMIPVTMNALLGTKIKPLLGYKGGGDVNLAIENGEIMGRINAWSGMKATKPDWIGKKEISILVQSALVSEPDLSGVPLLIDLAKNDDDHAIFRMFAATAELGRPLVAPPGVPQERVQELRVAFAATMNDPEFIAEAARLKVDIAPVPGERLEDMVNSVLGTPKPLIARLKAIVQ